MFALISENFALDTMKPRSRRVFLSILRTSFGLIVIAALSSGLRANEAASPAAPGSLPDQPAISIKILRTSEAAPTRKQLLQLVSDEHSCVLNLQPATFVRGSVEIDEPSKEKLPEYVTVNGKKVPVSVRPLGTKLSLTTIKNETYGLRVKMDFSYRALASAKNQSSGPSDLGGVYNISMKSVVVPLDWELWNFMGPTLQSDQNYLVVALRLQRPGSSSSR
jgi:hypothetical protein